MPGTPPLPWASPEVLDQILALGREGAPAEVCGIITPDLRVVALPNASPTDVKDSYALNGEDLVEAIEAYVERSGVEPQSLTRSHFMIWHTHPSGTVGPSKGDLEHKLEGFQYIVIALPSGESTIF